MKTSIAEQITNARKAAGMTQKDLASALHVTLQPFHPGNAGGLSLIYTPCVCWRRC